MFTGGGFVLWRENWKLAIENSGVGLALENIFWYNENIKFL